MIHQSRDVGELDRLQAVLPYPGIVYPCLQVTAALMVISELLVLLLQVPQSLGGRGEGGGRMKERAEEEMKAWVVEVFLGLFLTGEKRM